MWKKFSNLIKLKTWHIELFVISLILVVTTYFTKNTPTEYLGCLAVIFTFGFVQISDRLTEREAKKEKPSVDCYRKGLYYFIGKEVCWFLYFLINQSYSALVGVIIFLLYPIWRKVWRKYKPIEN